MALTRCYNSTFKHCIMEQKQRSNLTLIISFRVHNKTWDLTQISSYKICKLTTLQLFCFLYKIFRYSWPKRTEENEYVFFYLRFIFLFNGKLFSNIYNCFYRNYFLLYLYLSLMYLKYSYQILTFYQYE